MMKVFPIQGELIRFLVTGESVRCILCEKVFNDYPDFEEGEQLGRCRECGGKIERRKFQIDLGEYGGNGACGCEDFEYRHQQYATNRMTLSANERAILLEHDPRRCKHIRRARRHFQDEMIANLSRQEKQPQTTTTTATGKPKREYTLHR